MQVNPVNAQLMCLEYKTTWLDVHYFWVVSMKLDPCGDVLKKKEKLTSILSISIPTRLVSVV